MSGMSDHDDAPVDDAVFADLMRMLGPWPRSAPVAVAVSGGADSLCLAMLASDWAATSGLGLLALVVDHGLRPESAREAVETIDRLASRGIPSRLLTLRGLDTGSGLAERARRARYDVLRRACREAGSLDLLLGHHGFDQAETVLMRRRAGSGADGLAGMAPLVELDDVRLLRPLLGVSPTSLRATLSRRGIAWVEDPSNHDRRAERTRARQALSDAAGLRQALRDHAVEAGRARETRRRWEADMLAWNASLRPEGYALLPPELVPGSAMAALVRTVGGQAHRASAAAIDALLRRPRAMTLAGTRLSPAGRMGAGWLLAREACAVQAPVDAAPGVLWDGRFMLRGALPPHVAGIRAGALGPDAASMRRRSRLPATVLRTLPCLRGADGSLLAVPHLGWVAGPSLDTISFAFRPTVPATDSVPFTVLQPVSAMPA